MLDSYRLLINDLVGRLFEAEFTHFKHQVNTLIDDNNKLLGVLLDGFQDNGVNYGRDGNIVFDCRPLHRDLRARLNQLLSFRKTVELDRQLIHQILVKLVQPCQTQQDIRDALPECVVSLSPWLHMHARTREPAWTIQENPRDIRQYQKALARMETYSAMRFLY